MSTYNLHHEFIPDIRTNNGITSIDQDSAHETQFIYGEGRSLVISDHVDTQLKGHQIQSSPETLGNMVVV